MRYAYSITYYKYITYKANGGTGSDQTQTITSASAGTLKPASTFTRKNHTFKGWYTATTGGTLYTAGASHSVTSSNKGTMTLYAQWTPVQFTFKNGGSTLGSTLPAQNDNSLPTLTDTYKPVAGDHQFFCGYYTQEGGKGVQVYDSNLNPTAAGQSTNFTANTTLYAHFITNQHTVVWDYSYRYDASVYHNLDAHNRYGCLQFKNAAGQVFKTVYLTADEVTNKDYTTITGSLDTHTTSQMVIDLLVGDSNADVTTGQNAKIHFTHTELENMRGYQFDVWTTDGTTTGTKATNWYTNTNPTAHKTIFSYRGAISENMFWLSWNVTLTNLAMYPDKVYAKPMILVDGKYVAIDEMNGAWGEECFATSHIGTTGNGSSVTYSGEFPVLKNQTGGTAASYKIGMTGFFLAGGNYFLNQTQGNVPDDFVSSDAISFNGSGNDPGAKVDYTINDYDIPVVLLLPANPSAGVTDARINYLPQVLYVDQARASKVNLSNFVAERPHFNFLGWYDTEWTENGTNKVWGANEDYEFHTHTSPNGGTRTLIALWTRDSAPEASIAVEVKGASFDYTITATDDVAVKAVKYMVSADAPTAQTAGWTAVAANNGTYTVSIPRTNSYYGKYLYVLIENEGQNAIVKYADPIRSFIDIPANPDPDSKSDDVYTYYSTYYNSTQAFKLVNATAYKVSTVGDDDTLNLVDINANNVEDDGASAQSEDGEDNGEDNGEGEPDTDIPTEQKDPILPAQEAVILKASTPTITLELVESDETPSKDNTLEGVDVETSQLGNYDYYILSYAQYGLGFYKMKDGVNLAAHKAFIKLGKNANSAPAFRMSFGDGEITSINLVLADPSTCSGQDQNIYSPTGVRLSKLQQGINIVGGKKVIIK